MVIIYIYIIIDYIGSHNPFILNTSPTPHPTPTEHSPDNNGATLRQIGSITTARATNRETNNDK